MNTHRHMMKKLPAYALGDLDPARARQVRQHVTQCADCHEQVSHMQGVLDLADEFARLEATLSLQSAARKAIVEAAEGERRCSPIPLLAWAYRFDRIVTGSLVKAVMAAFIVVGILTTLYLRRHYPGPEAGSARVVPPNQVLPIPQPNEGAQDLALGQQEALFQQALAFHEQGRIVELGRLFAASTFETQLAVINRLADWENPMALALLAELVACGDLALEVRQAAARALEAAGPMPAESSESIVPKEPVPIQEPPRSDNTTETLLGLHVVDAETGQSLSDVQCQIGMYTYGKRRQETISTDAWGRCVFDHGDREYYHLSIRFFKPGYALHYRIWQGEPLPLQQRVTLTKGVAIGGVVKTETGQPIPGVTVSVQSNTLTPFQTYYHYTQTPQGKLVTDTEGRWRCEHFPSGAHDVRINLYHPAYLSVEPSGTYTTLDSLVGGDFPTWMRAGLRVTGTVFDQTGAPVPDASVVSVLSGGFSFCQRETKTHSDGVFCFENWESGQTVLTVKAAGYAQDCREILVGRGKNEVHFVLEPEYTLNVEVVDPEGKPIQGALVEGRYWRSEFRGLPLQGIRVHQETNEQGLAVLRTLPADRIGYRITKAGYSGLRCYVMKAIEGAYTATLWPQGRLTGRVFDRATRKPITAFSCKAFLHAEDSNIAEERKHFTLPALPPCVSVEEGQYDLPFLYHTDGLRVRVKAPGYPVYESPVFYNDGTALLHDIYLTQGEALVGTVYEPNGVPAAHVKVNILFAKYKPIRNGRFYHDDNQPVIQTDAFGRFHLMPQGRGFKLLILCDQGFAECEDTDLLTNPEIYLQAWGRVEGFVYSGLSPVAQGSVFLREVPGVEHDDRDAIRTGWFASAVTDPQGYFRLDRVRPGPVKMGRRIERSEGAALEMRTLTTEVLAGQSVVVQIGGGGRKVSGRFALPASLDPGILDHGTFKIYLATTDASPEDVNAPVKHTQEKAPNVVQLLATRAFLIDDIKPGRYVLKATFHDPQLYNHAGRSAYFQSCMAEIDYAFTVPEPYSHREYERVFELGDVPVVTEDSGGER